MNPNTIKNLLLKHCLQGELIACTEFRNGADVFSINQRYYSTEFEIKVSKADLRREFRIIESVINDRKKTGIKEYAKKTKHEMYLKNGHRFYSTIIKNEEINYYCFCVTEELAEITNKFITANRLPYGLSIVKKSNENYLYSNGAIHHIEQVIKPKRLIKTKCPQNVFEKVARRACWEAYNLRIKNKC